MQGTEKEEFLRLMAAAQRDEAVSARRAELRRARLTELLGRAPTLAEEIAAIYAESRMPGAPGPA